MNDCPSRKSIDVQDSSYQLSSEDEGVLLNLPSPCWTLTHQAASSQPWSRPSLFRPFLDSSPCQESPHPDLPVTDELPVSSSTQNPCLQPLLMQPELSFFPPDPPQGTTGSSVARTYDCAKPKSPCFTSVLSFPLEKSASKEWANSACSKSHLQPAACSHYLA